MSGEEWQFPAWQWEENLGSQKEACLQGVSEGARRKRWGVQAIDQKGKMRSWAPHKEDWVKMM